MQVVLRAIQRVDEMVTALQGLHHQHMLQCFLNNRLYASLHVTCFARKCAHAFHIEFPGNDKEGQNAHNDEGQGAVHEEKEQEGPDKLTQGGDERRHRLGGEAYHIGHVPFYAVGQIARMVCPQVGPRALQQMGEQVAAHLVLRLHTQNGLDPTRGYYQCDARYHDTGNQPKRLIQRNR